jgi:hypothetical protein
VKPHLFFAELVGLYGVGLAAASVAAATAIAARDHVDRGHGVPFSPKKMRWIINRKLSIR